jgi:hypothetical protein
MKALRPFNKLYTPIIYDVIRPIMESFEKATFSWHCFCKRLIKLDSPFVLIQTSRLQEVRGDPPLVILQQRVSVPEGD